MMIFLLQEGDNLNITQLLIFNLKAKYGNLVAASRHVGISAATLQNWADSKSKPNMTHLNIISNTTKINASLWISENFLVLSSQSEYTETVCLHNYFRVNIDFYLRQTGKRRRDFVNQYNNSFIDSMSPNTFDGYRSGRTVNIPLHRLEELSTFFNCEPNNLIEVRKHA